MSKKLITACLGLVALAAFALPAVASAANKPVITHPTGTAMSTRTTTCEKLGEAGCLLGTSIGATLLKNGEGTTTLTECETATLTGHLEKNASGTIEGEIKTATFQSPKLPEYKGMHECHGVSIFPDLTVTTNGTDPINGPKTDNEDVSNGTPYCVRSTPTMAEDEFQVRGGTCTEAARKITFVFDTTPFFSGDAERECRYERAEAIKGTFTTDTTGDAIFTILPAGSKFTGEAGNNVLCPGSGTLEMKFTMETDAEPASPVYISQLP